MTQNGNVPFPLLRLGETARVATHMIRIASVTEGVRKGGMLLVLPAVVILVAAGLRNARGPAWLACSDPDYVYLLNGALIASGDVAPYSDHPGTTLHLVHGAAIAVVHSLCGGGSITEDVLRRPEFYLDALNGIWILLVSLGSLCAGLAIFRRTGSLWLAVLVQMTPFLSAANVQALYRVNPEPAMLGLGQVVLALVFWGRPEWVHSWRRPVWAAAIGTLAGLGVGMKLTFLPVLIVAAVAVEGLAYQALCLVVAASVFGILVYCPCVGTGEYIFKFGGMVLRGTGQYAGAGGGTMTWGTFLDTMQAWGLRVVAAEWPILLVVAGGVAVLVSRLLTPRLEPADRERRWQVRTLAVLVCAELLQVALAAKGLNMAIRYLVPAWSLVGGTLVLSVLVSAELRPDWRRRLRGRITLVLIAVAMTGAAVRLLACGKELGAGCESGLAASRRLALEFPNSRVVQYAGAPSVERALEFGNNWAWKLLSDDLTRVYPKYVFFNLDSGWLENFSGTVDPAAVFDGTSDVLLWGGAEPRLETCRWTRQLFAVNNQYVYRVDPGIVSILPPPLSSPPAPIQGNP